MLVHDHRERDDPVPVVAGRVVVQETLDGAGGHDYLGRVLGGQQLCIVVPAHWLGKGGRGVT